MKRVKSFYQALLPMAEAAPAGIPGEYQNR